MALDVGSRIGPYELLEKLGEGGMGVVYRASDARLDREVAIKVLPRELTDHADRATRFEREAKLLASLNHPNIAQLYGVEELAGGGRALVMELVGGTTLDERLAAGALPIDEALAIAGEIAGALAAAHDKGIVHRDLKPQNVRLTADGTVKVLDFGLAKSLLADSPASGSAPAEVVDSPTLMNSPTLAGGTTELGVILGTAAYMSPEQARGHPVDRRADVWAFGCVLFEMLAGQRLFQGNTTSDTLAAVLRQEIPWRQLPVDLPRPARILLRRCLAREPRERLRDLADARLFLRPLEDDEPNAPETGDTRQGGRWLALAPWGLAAALGLACLGLWLAGGSAPRETSNRPVVLAAKLPAELSLPAQNIGQTQILAVSPDGSRIAFLAKSPAGLRLFLRSLEHAQVVAVPGTLGAASPFFSPDGRWIGFFARGKLRKVAVAGGEPVELCDSGLDRGGVWASDGTIVFSPEPASGLMRIPASGGVATPLTTLDEANLERSHRWPALMPSGREIAFTVGVTAKPGSYEDASIDAVDLTTGRRRQLVRGASMVRVTPTGHLLLGREGEVQAMPLDAARGDFPSEATQVLAGVGGDPASGVVYFDVAGDGTLVYAERNSRYTDHELVWLDREGRAEVLPFPLREYRIPRLSPDGSRIAVGIGRGRGGESDLWIGDLGTGSLNRLTFDGRSEIPAWTLDGKSVTYITGAPPLGRMLRKAVDGGEEPTVVATLDPSRVRGPLEWARDGSLLISEDFGAGSANDLIRLVPGEREPRAVARTSAVEIGGTYSPDGRLLAYSINSSGAADIFVQEYPGPGGRWLVFEGSNGAMRWSRDGRELLVITEAGIHSVPIDPGPPFRSGLARLLFHTSFLETQDVYTNFDAAPDGRILAVRRVSDEEFDDRLVVTLDWFERLREIVPLGAPQR